MKKINAEGVEFIYLNRDDRIPQGSILGLEVQVLDPTEIEVMEKYIPHHDDTRCVLVQPQLSPGTLRVQYFQWYGKLYLDVLDLKVAQNLFADSDFALSLITDFSETLCFNCHRKWYTLVARRVAVSTAFTELINKKIEIWFSERLFETKCPNCGEELRQLVTRIIGEAT
jgi:hypothetical protein